MAQYTMINRFKIFSLLITMLVCQGTLFSQRTFVKSIETNKRNRSVFVFASGNSPIVWQPDSLSLSKYDKCGSEIWHKQYKFTTPNRIVLKSGFKTLMNGKFAFVTTENYTNYRNSRVTLIDSNGNISWSKSFRMANSTMVSYSVMQNSSGDLFIFGNKNAIGGGPSNCFIYKLNLNGNVLWSKSYSIGGTWGGAILTSDQGILMRTGMQFIKINSLGNVQWSTSISDLGSYFFAAPIEVSDGYIFTGTNSGTSLSMSFYKLDKQGNLPALHKKTITLNSIHRSLTSKTDSSFVCVLNASLTRQFPTIIEMDKDLNIVKKNTLHLSNSTVKLLGTGIAFLSDGTPIVSGITDSAFNNKSFFGLLTTDYKLGCDTSIYDSTFIQTITQTTLTVTSVNTASLVEEDSSYTEITLNFALKTLCEDNTFSLDLGADTTICPNSSIVLYNKSSERYDQYTWSTGANTPSISVNMAGVYWLTATDNCSGVTISDTILVGISNFPIPSDSTMDTVICNNEYITINAQIPMGIYLWQDNSSLPYFVADKPGNYYVDITSDNCTQRFNYTIKSCSGLFIPNVFSPNGDNINDMFTIRYLGFDSYNLLIYNRWGDIVFESNDRDIHWNGDFNNKIVSQGVYFYVLSIGEKRHKGNVSVFR